MKRFIPLSRPEITNEDKRAVLGVLNTPYLALGPKLEEFEKEIAKYVGRKYAVAVNSGTSALHLIIRALGIKSGDEVITTPFSFIASANCILFEGAKPVFTDIDPRTKNIDPRKIESAITKKTKAILAVDVFGYPAEWNKLKKIAKRHKLLLIEDSAEAIGSEYTSTDSTHSIDSGQASSPQASLAQVRARKCGSFGDAAIFSFYPNKQIVMGEGGILVTDDPKIYELSRSMRNQGRDEQVKTKGIKKGEYRSWLQHVRLGYNYRISDINCALGLSQLKRIEKIMRKRQRVARMYNEQLCKISEIRMPSWTQKSTINPFVYVVELSSAYSEKDRNAIIEKLKERGIQSSNYFPSIHLQPFYRKLGYRKGGLPVSEGVSSRVIALPFFNNLSEKEIIYITTTLKRLL